MEQLKSVETGESHMKTGRTLNQLAQELTRQRTAKRDFLVHTSCMHMSVDAAVFELFNRGQTHMGGPQEFGMTGLFHRKLGASIGIPYRYYDKMREQCPELLARNVNTWLEREPSRHLVRTLDGKARAYLSDSYRRIDHDEIMEAVLPIIGEMPDAKVESCEVTENRLYLKVVNPRLEAEVTPGDVVQAGIIISNSEVGLGNVSVQPLVYRLVCKNGMVVSEGQKRRHSGRTIEEDWELFSDETKRADDRAFMLKLADIVRAAVDEARFAVMVDRLRDATEQRFAGYDVPYVVELTAKEYALNETERGGVMQYLIDGGELSQYGLSSAVTRAAQDVDDYDRSTEMEGIGWQIVTMAPEVWKHINGGVRT